MNVHAKEAGDPRGILIGKMKDLDLYENTAGRGVVECGKAPYRTYGIPCILAIAAGREEVKSWIK